MRFPTPSKRALIVIGGVIVVLIAGGAILRSYLLSKDRSTGDQTPQEKGLEAVCQGAVNDYPEWAKNNGPLVVWATNTGELYIRQSSNNLVEELSSPAGGTGELVNLDVLGTSAVGYLIAAQNGTWSIGIFDWGNSKGDIIYETAEPLIILDVAFINSSETLILYKQESSQELGLRLVSKTSGMEETLFKTKISTTGNGEASQEKQKVTVSPKGSYAYLLSSYLPEKEGNLIIFALASKKQVAALSSASSAVWMGDEYLLYSKTGEEGGVFLYDLVEKAEQKITEFDSQATDLMFNPQSGGIIAYNLNPESYEAKGHVISCQTKQALNTYSHGIIEALADHETAIASKYAPDISIDRCGYWQFVGQSREIEFISDFASHYSGPTVATTWSRY